MSSAVAPARNRPVRTAPEGAIAAASPPKKPLMTSAAKASAWDLVGDAAFAAVIGLVAAFAAGYGTKGGVNNVLNAIGPAFEHGNGVGGLATVVVGPAIFLYLGHRANRFPFFPSDHPRGTAQGSSTTQRSPEVVS